MIESVRNHSVKIPSPTQVSALDDFTIENEPILSIELMERASEAFCNWFEKKFPSREKPILILAGPGNNGGDGLAVARILAMRFFNARVLFFGQYEKSTKDCRINFDKFKKVFPNRIKFSTKSDISIDIQLDTIIIDALLGSGLSRPIEGEMLELVKKVNLLQNIVVSIDTPTGMFADKPTSSTSINADHTLSFEFPKLGFLLPENEERVPAWEFHSIGLSVEGIRKMDCNNYWLTRKAIKKCLPQRKKFSHKGQFGKILLYAGHCGFAGAAILSGRGCMRAGAGLLYILTEERCIPIIQAALPEAICLPPKHNGRRSLPEDTNIFNVLACGPGIGQSGEAVETLVEVLEKAQAGQCLILDADALNIVASEKLIKKLPPKTILTPHPGEFDRLFGSGSDDFETLEIQRQASREFGLNILFKGAYSRLSTPDGEVFFNPTGNPGMATAGSGDVLTGVIAAMAGRGLEPSAAAATGMYLHGLAGDCAAKTKGKNGMIAGDIADFMPAAMKTFE